MRGCVSYAFRLRSQAFIFAVSPTVLGGVSQLSVGQWWRIIGSFTPLTIVFLEKITD
ncbi:conserved hypothetical protein [Xenorhabdus nematophila F1]|nr:conserved hypothetical protein [Xenorhabdus nematophila F1]